MNYIDFLIELGHNVNSAISEDQKYSFSEIVYIIEERKLFLEFEYLFWKWQLEEIRKKDFINQFHNDFSSLAILIVAGETPEMKVYNSRCNGLILELYWIVFLIKKNLKNEIN
jgi:hypothetical protein